MKIILTLSSIIRAIEYLMVIVISAVLMASMFRYLMRFGFAGSWFVGYPLAFVILPILLATHHYKRVFFEEPESIRFWKALGLALFSAATTYVLAFKIDEWMFPPYNYGPGP